MNRHAGFTHAHTRSLSFPFFFCLRHNPRPDRDHARVRQEFALRYTAPLAPSIHGTWHKPPPRFSQRPPSALPPTLLSDRCEPPTTAPCVPPLIAPRCASSHAPVSRPRDAPTGRSADPCGPQRAGVHVLAQGQGLLACVRRGGVTCHMKDRMKHHIKVAGTITPNDRIQGSDPRISPLISDL